MTTDRNELIRFFKEILDLAAKIDRNQQKVNFLHFKHGAADEAHHWQEFVDAQRVRHASMIAKFREMTEGLDPEVVGQIGMEAVGA